jgi:threonyl-tRNA synthetase
MNITDAQGDYAARVADILKGKEIRTELDLRNEKIGFKIREARLQKVPYMLIVGDREVADHTVNIRDRSGEQNTITLDEFIALVKSFDPVI